MAANWSRPPLHSNESFSLPAGAENLFFLSRGSLAYGAVLIEAANEPSNGDAVVKVDVDIWYHSSEALARASVRAIEVHDNEDRHGVGIFTPQSWHGWRERDRLYFEVVIRLPLGIYNSFETDYENFSLCLQGMVAFENARLKTSNGTVHAESLQVLQGAVTSSNGPITGKYTVTGSLQLVTSNSGIETTVDIYSEDLHVTPLLLNTSNGPIISELRLHGPPSSSAFKVQAGTSNAPALIYVPSHPHASPLALGLHTSNGPARVALHPAFEGTFALHTSAFTPAILRAGNENIVDPSGEGRSRAVQVSRQAMGTSEGRVWWGDWMNLGKGWVHITSSNSPVGLDLTGGRPW